MFKEVFILFFLTFLFVSCGQDEVVEKKKQRTINITTSLVQIYNFKDQESAIGTIEGLVDPTIRSEIASSVKKIYTKTGFILKKGDLIAYTGNSGSSGGPHLHYEIRDSYSRPMNPMLFGLEIPDTKGFTTWP